MTSKHRILRKCVPEIICIPGCTLCCDNVQNAIADPILPQYSQYPFKAFKYKDPDLFSRCKSANGSGCNIYNHRPLDCLVWWKTEGDPACLAGIKPEKPLTVEQLRRIMWCWQYGTEQDALALKAEMLVEVYRRSPCK